MFRRRKNREMQFAKINLQIALLGDGERVFDGLGRVGEARLHFLRRPQIKLLRLVAHPFRLGQLRLRADANQAVVRVRMAFLDVMNVIRRDELEAEFLRPQDQVLVDLRLFGNAVVLQFEEKIVRAERLLEPVHRVARLVQLVFEDPIRDFAREAAGHRDQAFLVRGQDFLVNARLVIIALQMRGGGKLDEVFVAGLVLGQQAEMMINVASAAAGFLFQPAARRDINLAADNGLDALFARRLVKINDAVHRAMVGDGERGEFQFLRLVHQPVQTAGAIEQRILGVQMQMDKIGVRHGGSLTSNPEDTKPQSFEKLTKRQRRP